MLSYQLLGGLCLFVLWATALAVAAAAWKELGALGELRARLRPLPRGARGVGLLEGDVELVAGGEGDGWFASHEVVQIGRAALGDERTIVFRDRAHVSRVTGGSLRGAAETWRVGADEARAAVWTTLDAQRSASTHADDAAFDAAYVDARGDGLVRTVATRVRAGDRVFVAGEVVEEGGALVVRAPDGGELVVATEDPRVFVASRTRLVAAFIVGELLACALATRLALWQPLFGRVGTLGGVLCLGFFLAVTPIGVWVRDRCRPPSRAFLHGVWTKGA